MATLLIEMLVTGTNEIICTSLVMAFCKYQNLRYRIIFTGACGAVDLRLLQHILYQI